MANTTVETDKEIGQLNQSFRFLDLPAELRVAVYELVLRPEPHVFTIPDYRHHLLSKTKEGDEKVPSLEIQLLRTCRQVYHEGQDVLYNSGSRFHMNCITHHHGLVVKTDGRLKVKAPFRKIQHLTIYMFAMDILLAYMEPLEETAESFPVSMTALKDVRLAVIGTYGELNLLRRQNTIFSKAMLQAILRIIKVVPNHVAVQAERGLQDHMLSQNSVFRLDHVYPDFGSEKLRSNVYQVDADKISAVIASVKDSQGRTSGLRPRRARRV